MRVLLCVDMEGVSQITSFRELWPEFQEEWEAGKAATTADVLAAVTGLRAGGAGAISICELHGLSAEPIVDIALLPGDVERVEAAEYLRNASLSQAHDALFLLGWHARCGTPNGFMSHTSGLNLRVAVEGKPVTEVHINGWRSGLPVLGVTGDEALAEQLDGGLDGVPFLAVKRSTERASATALFSESESAAAIQSFATWCAAHAAEREPLRIPERFVFALSMPPTLADRVEGAHGLRRTSPAIVAKSATDWWYDAEPALAKAVQESFRPLADANGAVEERQTVLEQWVRGAEAEWLI